MHTINIQHAIQDAASGTSVIIDVREAAEFADHHLPNAINIPSSAFNTASFTPYQNQNIYLVCQSGNRANSILKKLQAAGFSQVFVMEEHMADLPQQAREKGWSVDRQFRLTLGVLLLVFLAGNYWLSPYFLIIPAILCTGLIVTAIIDRCYMRMGIALLPWNRGKKG